MVCERKSPEDQNQVGRERFLREGKWKSVRKGQKSAEIRTALVGNSRGEKGTSVI